MAAVKYESFRIDAATAFECGHKLVDYANCMIGWQQTRDGDQLARRPWLCNAGEVFARAWRVAIDGLLRRPARERSSLPRDQHSGRGRGAAGVLFSAARAAALKPSPEPVIEAEVTPPSSEQQRYQHDEIGGGEFDAVIENRD